MKTNKTFKYVSLLVGTTAIIVASGLLAEHLLPQMNTDMLSDQSVERDPLMNPSDAQVDSMLMQLHRRNNTSAADAEKTFKSLNNYNSVLKARQNRGKTK